MPLFLTHQTKSLMMIIRFSSVVNILLAMVIVIAGDCLASDKSKTVNLLSPNGRVNFQVEIHSNQKGDTELSYSITLDKNQVINKSAFSLILDNHMSEWALAIKSVPTKPWMGGLQLKEIKQDSISANWKPVYGERSDIVNIYNTATLVFAQRENSAYTMNIEVRVYDTGAAFRYFFPDNPTGIYYRIMKEETEFSLPAGSHAWFTPWAQALSERLPLKNWPTESERPLTIELPNGKYVALAEAAVKDYVRTKFSLSSKKKNTLVTSMHDPVDLITGTGTPWRVVMIADSAAKLLEGNDLLLNLNEASVIKDVSWIKPGKIVRDMSLTNEGAYAWIDFAAKHNLQYLLFDWKWYGPAFTFESDAGKVAIDLDLQNIIKYGKSKGVGIWLYVNQQALLKQDAEIFKIYKDWGIAGVKYGFVEVGAHRWVAWLHDSLQRAADNQLMVNVHDEFRPTGEQRTWPNLVTAEGIRGNEEMPDATSNTILPFTRGLAGMGDYTVCYYSDRIKTTHAHQLALSVVMYSPLQTLFWYDKASDYSGEPEVEFFSKVPTVWDDTKVLSGAPGEHIVTARRSGSEWFIGAITNTESRNINATLNFLEPHTEYVARIYYDDINATTKTRVSQRDISVTNMSTLDLALQASGGAAIWIRKK